MTNKLNLVQVFAAMQSHMSTFADSARYFVILGKALRDAREHETDFHPDFLAHAYHVFDRRWAEMATPTTRLCLFLHPGYRLLSNRADDLEELKREVSCTCKSALPACCCTFLCNALYCHKQFALLYLHTCFSCCLA